ncbi:MAG TPA: endopeptidase La [Longimicrobiales bacterium]
MPNEHILSIPKPELPERLPILPLTDTVVFPHIVVPMAVAEQALVQLVDQAAGADRQLALVTVRPGRTPEEADLADPPFFGVGTLGLILQHVRLPDASMRLLIQGRQRVRLGRFQHDGDVWSAAVELLAPREDETARVQALHRIVLGQFQEIVALSPQAPEALRHLLDSISDPAQLADFISASLDLPVDRKQELLEEVSVARRLEKLAAILGEEQKVLEYGTQIQQKLKDEVEKTQRELWLREQLRIIQKELGEGEEDDVTKLREQIEAAQMPEPARAQADRELRRLERTLPQAPDYHIIRSYLDWLVGLPWARETQETIDLGRARQILDRDHYDLDDVKERIIEFLAVRKLNPELKGPILCFVGPPGVGKTSLGRSIAEALGRRFTRMSLGGIRDEAEIRGHRRTYVGALPGRIVRGIGQADVRNPVFMLDEIDKVGQDFRGDPTAALLEVLDPAQNHSFSDHYLEVPFDLSHVMFIATANTLATVPPALHDRLEVLELPGYTSAEKFEIARRHQIPRQLEAAGLASEDATITDDALRRLIAEYTREAGVRELERQIARILRKVALRRVEGVLSGHARIDPSNLEEFAGKRRFEQELAGRSDEVGTATALAYTPMGGQILFVEAVAMAGEGEARLTGQLGDIMKESAQAALSYVRSHGRSFGIREESVDGHDVHIHVPAGATPKDGPSAGVALVVALASLFSGRPVRRDVAMTGEITLRGHVLPVGGTKEKLIAAAQAGIRTVLLPRRNEPDLDEVPEDVKQQLELVLVGDVAEALEHALRAESVGGEEASSRAAP